MSYPTIDEIRAARIRIDPYIRKTPVWQWNNAELAAALDAESGAGSDLGDPETEVILKLELFQHTGSFKPRGALNNILNLDRAALERGVTAISAGNHAIAVSYAAAIAGTTAKVVMPMSANPIRVEKSRSFGAEVELLETVHAAFERVRAIEESEGRYFVHPFDGPLTVTGAATVGLEWAEQVAALDAVIVPIGGGGLCAGIAAAVKQLQPGCAVYGVEPTGADTMFRSMASGRVESIDAVRTIADSLGAPYTTEYTLGVCRKFVDEVVLIDDHQMRAAMGLLFHGMKLAVEPAGAAATAALCGPLRARLAGKRVGVIVCGANIDLGAFAAQAGGA
jgi:threonine dehydratase